MPTYPIAGRVYQVSDVNTPFGGEQSRSKGFTGALPDEHQGIDLNAKEGEPVVAADGGVVVTAGLDNTGFGNTVVVKLPNGSTQRYAHLSAFAPGLKPGDTVREGQPLGAVGHTGNATGPHLHFEVHAPAGGGPVDPVSILQGSKSMSSDSPPVSNDFTAEFARQKAKAQQLLEHYAEMRKAVPIYKAYASSDPTDPTVKGGLHDDEYFKQHSEVNKEQMNSYKPLYEEAMALDRVAWADKLTKLEADAKDDFDKASENYNKAANPTVKNPPKGEPKQTIVDGPDGTRYITSWLATGNGDYTLDPGKPATPVPGMQAKLATHVTDLNDRVIIYDDAGNVIQSFQKDQSDQKPVTDPATGDVYLINAAGVLGNTPIFKGKPQTITGDNKVFPVDRTTGLPDVSRGVDLRSQEEQTAASVKTQAEMLASQWTVDRGQLINKLKGELASSAKSASEVDAELSAWDRQHETAADRLKRQQQEENIRSTRDADAAKQGAAAMRAGSLHFLARAQGSSGVPGNMTSPAETIIPQSGESIGVAILRKYGMWNDSLAGSAAPTPTPTSSVAATTATSTPAAAATPAAVAALLPTGTPGSAFAAALQPRVNAAPRTPVPGKEAIDLGNGQARTIYTDGTQEDWLIPQASMPEPALQAA